MASNPLNSVQPELGNSSGWDRPRLEALLKLTHLATGELISKHAEANANGFIFGGQLIGQAIAAAAHDVPPGMTANNLQMSFLAPGQTREDLRFEVTRLLNGRNFVVQQVLCRQSERMVFSAQVSFHRGEPGPDFTIPMPADVPSPETLPTLREVVLKHADEMGLNDATRARVGNSRNLEIRPVNGRELLMEPQPAGHLMFWTKAIDKLPDAALLHQAALGYMSDYWFPIAAISPHLKVKVNTGLYIASLNHSIWFYLTPKADEWLLVDARAQRTVNGRGLSQGTIYSRDGQAIANVMQETLFRGWDKLVAKSASSLA